MCFRVPNSSVAPPGSIIAHPLATPEPGLGSPPFRPNSGFSDKDSEAHDGMFQSGAKRRTAVVVGVRTTPVASLDKETRAGRGGPN